MQSKPHIEFILISINKKNSEPAETDSELIFLI